MKIMTSVNHQNGTSERSGHHVESSVPILRIPNVVNGKLDLSDLNWIVLTQKEQERFSVHKGDILIVRTNGNPKYVGRSAIIEYFPSNAVYASYLIRLRVDEAQVRPAYINALLNSKYLRTTLQHEIRSSAGNYNLNTEGIRKQQIPLPTLREQDQLLEKISLIKFVENLLEQHVESSAHIKKVLLDQLLNTSAKGK